MMAQKNLAQEVKKEIPQEFIYRLQGFLFTYLLKERGDDSIL